jgi:hypothetical protein
MAARDRGQRIVVLGDPGEERRHHDPAERGEGLGDSEDALAPRRIGEQLGEPGHGRDELHADSHEGQAAQKEENRQGRGESGSPRRKRIEEDASREHGSPTEAIGEVSAEQSEDAAADRGQIEHQVPPQAELGRAELVAAESHDGGRQDERQHEQLVGVEGEPERGQDDDHPFDERQRLIFLGHGSSIILVP